MKRVDVEIKYRTAKDSVVMYPHTIAGEVFIKDVHLSLAFREMASNAAILQYLATRLLVRGLSFAIHQPL